MATVAGTLKLNDKMTPALKSVVTAINSTLNAMENMDVAASAAFRAAKRDAAIASAEVSEFAQGFDNVPPRAQKAEQSLSGMISKAMSLTALIYGLQKAMQGIGAITGLSDSMSQSISRLNQINDGYRTTLEYQNMIFASANRARSSYLDTIDAVTKFGANAKDAFSGTEEIIAFTELMNKSFKLSGASAQEQAGAMRQLSQALASGVLRGDEFNSIAEQAPMVYEAIANYMGKSKGEVRELAADGKVTAEIVKNAMFASAEDIESRFSNTPMRFADIMARIQNSALKAFRPVFDRISELAQSERFSRFAQQMSLVFLTAADYALRFINVVAEIGAYVQDNSDTVVVCLGAIAAALVILKAQAVAAGMASMATAAASALAWLAAAWPILLVVGILAALVIAYQNTEGTLKMLIAIIGVIVLAIGAWVAIQWVLNAALTANPIGAIIMAIVILIGVIVAIIVWITDLWKTNLDFKYGVLAIWDSILFFFKSVPLFFQKVGYGIADAFSYAKVQVLTILQNMANGAINIINNLIGLLNKIPGVAIDPLSQLTFAASAAAEEEAHRQARSTNLTESSAALEAEKAVRQAQREAERAADQARLDAESAEKAKKKSGVEQAAEGYDYSKYLDGDKNLGNIDKVGKVGKIEDDITISEDDIKMLKDIASIEYQLRYTQLTPQLQVSFGDVRETADAGKILEFIESSLDGALSSSLYVEVGT